MTASSPRRSANSKRNLFIAFTINYIIPEGVTSIGDDAFVGCSSSFRICGVEGSYAQKYASDNDINFEILSEPNVTEPVSGDTNNDGIVSAADFIKLVQHILNPEMQINSKTSDLNGDGKIDSADADEFKKLFLRYSKRNK